LSASLDHVDADGNAFLRRQSALLRHHSALAHTEVSEVTLPSHSNSQLSVQRTRAYDYFHVNSVDKNASGDYLISAWDAFSMPIVDNTSGWLYYTGICAAKTLSSVY